MPKYRKSSQNYLTKNALTLITQFVQKCLFHLKVQYNAQIHDFYSGKPITEILIENNLPVISPWKYQLHRLKNKLKTKKMEKTNNFTQKPKSINQSKSTKNNTSDNDLWTCTIIPKNYNEINVNSTNNIQNTLNVSNPTDNFKQRSDTCSISTKDYVPNATTSATATTEIINDQNLSNNCPKSFGTNKSPAKIRTEVFLSKTTQKLIIAKKQNILNNPIDNFFIKCLTFYSLSFTFFYQPFFFSILLLITLLILA